jgi:hypothetical protein
MSPYEIIQLVVLIVVTLALIATVVVAIVRGDMKKFVEEKMVEAEKLELSGKVKLEYVLNAVKEKYKIMTVILDVKKVIEHIIELSKQINYKK